MDALDIIDEHLAIRETVGYEVLNEVPIEDMPKVLEFLKIVYNYNRMKRASKEEEKQLVWVEEQELIRRILDDPRNADGFSDDSHRYPKYNYDGYTYILNDNLTKILSVSLERDTTRLNLEEKDKVAKKFKLKDSFQATLESAVVEDVPAMSWMDQYRGDYDKLLASGMFFEFHPTWTGVWDRDKYAFCYDKKYENILKKK